MKLRAGDMVTVHIVAEIDLFAEPFSPDSSGDPDPVSHLTCHDTAVIVSLSTYDGKCVYVVGPHGAGWAFGAYLKRIK